MTDSERHFDFKDICRPNCTFCELGYRVDAVGPLFPEKEHLRNKIDQPTYRTYCQTCGAALGDYDCWMEAAADD